MATIVKGKEIAQKILDELKAEVGKLSFQPVFCDVLVGDDPVSRSYVNTKARAAEQIGLRFDMLQVPQNITTEELIAKLKSIQSNPLLAGLIIQLPLPEHLDKLKILNAIDRSVDVDCLNGIDQLVPPTAGAILTVLETLNLDLSKLKILVIGQGELVGKPVTSLLMQKGYNVTTADESTTDLKQLTVDADIIISATGQPKLINADLIKLGAILIDCGTAESNGGISGDVDLESVSAKAGVVSPVPGGVGPVTVARLLQNVVSVAKTIK